jgi:hypothetical protein
MYGAILALPHSFSWYDVQLSTGTTVLLLYFTPLNIYKYLQRFHVNRVDLNQSYMLSHKQIFEKTDKLVLKFIIFLIT